MNNLFQLNLNQRKNDKENLKRTLSTIEKHKSIQKNL